MLSNRDKMVDSTVRRGTLVSSIITLFLHVPCIDLHLDFQEAYHGGTLKWDLQYVKIT
jgi:hypothetical protein